jgi:hypothetical protein
VAVQVDSDDLPALRECGEHGSEHIDRSQAAVQQQQRLALAVNLVVVVEPVGLDVSALDGLALRVNERRLREQHHGRAYRCKHGFHWLASSAMSNEHGTNRHPLGPPEFYRPENR